MMKDEMLNSLEDAVEALLRDLSDDLIDSDQIKKIVTAQSKVQEMLHNVSLSEEEIILVTRRLEERFDINMDCALLFEDEKRYQPWLEERKSVIDSYYWDRHKRYLAHRKFTKKIIEGINEITDQTLDRLGDPEKPAPWKRKGMVVGHVQSGKTANYTSLICKAADAGYKVIIVLAGLLNSLRNQTQERIDEGFVGIDSLRVLDNSIPINQKLIGVGKIDYRRRPVTFTTRQKDFEKGTATKIGVGLDALNEPLVLVVKKNTHTLRNLHSWFQGNNLGDLSDFPMLIIDDEADHASINTRQDDDDATAINKGIRKLLKLFNRSSYLGYTATPFANIFINPKTNHEMFGDDLFPEDFIITLEAPTNYVGPAKIFSDDSEFDIVRPIWDNEDILPVKHAKDHSPEDLPKSLKKAVYCFVLCRAIRLLRRQGGKHNSMMINVSRFTLVQTNIKYLVNEFIEKTKTAINNYASMPEKEALKNSSIKNLYDIWKKEYVTLEFSWAEVQFLLQEAVCPIEVIEVNSSPSAEPLDYDKTNYPEGRNVIAIGGLGLSRGLTLEGLTVSYFLRNSIMYDTLMQMGRWFGYRDGYGDLCRIFMTEDARSWYAHISNVLIELRGEFHRMKMAKMTPKDFGLCVRCHPESLIVTARNKMRTGITVCRQISLAGRNIESSTLLNSQEAFIANWNCMKQLVDFADDKGRRINNRSSIKGCFWEDVPHEGVLDFVYGFMNHPACAKMEKTPLLDYISRLERKNHDKWDFAFIGLANGSKKPKNSIKINGSISLIPEKRQCTLNGTGIFFKNRRVASGGDEKSGLTDDQLQSISKEKPSDRDYRHIRNKPLIMLHVMNLKDENDQPFFDLPVIAYGLSFPGNVGDVVPDELVEYRVNTTWWDNEYADLLEEAEEVEYEM